MESVYKKLKLRQKHIKELINLGVIDPCVLRDLEIYEEYHTMEMCYLCKCEILGEKFGVSSSSIQKIVRKLKRAA